MGRIFVDLLEFFKEEEAEDHNVGEEKEETKF